MLRPQAQEDDMKTFSTAKDFNVLEVYVHPKFEEIKDVITYDFALLRLDYPIADNAYGIGFASKYRKVIIKLGKLKFKTTKFQSNEFCLIKNLSLKYQRVSPSGCKDVRI